VIARYTRRELADAWSDFARFDAMREVEVAACEEMDGPTPGDLAAIRSATFTVEAIDERERVTDHDTAAFVDVLAESAGPSGRWIQYGLTSSDVVDTGMALQIKRVGELILPDARALVAAIAARARELDPERRRLGVDAVGPPGAERVHVLAGYAFEADRNLARLERAFDQAAVGAVSGEVAE
jgi:adenylosuccinate lyase